MEEYIEIGKLNRKLFEEININLITEEVIFTLERMEHVDKRRVQYKRLFEVVKCVNHTPIGSKEM